MKVRVCRAPGCGKELSHDNRSGVCRNHNHAKGICACATCDPDGVLRSQYETEHIKEGTRVVRQKFNGWQSNLSPSKKTITLRKEPWI